MRPLPPRHIQAPRAGLSWRTPSFRATPAEHPQRRCAPTGAGTGRMSRRPGATTGSVCRSAQARKRIPALGHDILHSPPSPSCRRGFTSRCTIRAKHPAPAILLEGGSARCERPVTFVTRCNDKVAAMHQSTRHRQSHEPLSYRTSTMSRPERVASEGIARLIPRWAAACIFAPSVTDFGDKGYMAQFGVDPAFPGADPFPLYWHGLCTVGISNLYEQGGRIVMGTGWADRGLPRSSEPCEACASATGYAPAAPATGFGRRRKMPNRLATTWKCR